MAQFDVYELTHVMMMGNQTIYNVYTYQQNDITVGQTLSSAQLLAEDFEADVQPVIAGIMTSDVSFIKIIARNLFNETDAHTLLTTGNGAIVGNVSGATNDSLPTFTQFPFTLVQGNGAVKNGSKRFAGVDEGVQTDGVVTNAGMLTELQDVADALLAELGGAGGADPSFDPVIVKRVRTGSPGAYEYRLPENLGEAVIGLVIDVLFDVILSHQISRTIGVGI